MDKVLNRLFLLLIILFSFYSKAQQKVLLDKVIAVIYKPFSIEREKRVITWYELKNYSIAVEMLEKRIGVSGLEELLSNNSNFKIEFWRELLSKFILSYILNQQFKKSGKKFTKEIYNIWEQFEKREKLKGLIERFNLDKYLILKYIEMEFVKRRLLKEMIRNESIFVSEEEIKEYYQREKKMNRLSYEKAKSIILKILKDKKRKVMLKNKLNDIIKQYKIEIIDKNFELKGGF